MNVDIDIPQSEINRMARQVQVWQRERHRKLVALIDETTDLIYNDVRSSVPVRSGNLKDSIKKSLRKGITPHGTVEMKAFYGWFLETGTVHRPATPFLKPAYQRHIPAFIAKLKLILS